MSKEKNEFDKMIKNIAKSVSKSLNEKGVREAIKNEALLKIDGDFDILWKDFKVKKSKNSTQTFNEIISENCDFDVNTKIEKLNKLNEFSQKYKRLQISVPINCENWDTEYFIPYVVYITSGYDENQELIEAINSDGEIVMISNKIEPNFPIVVVGINERSDEDGNILPFYKNSMEKSMSIVNLPKIDYIIPPQNLAATSSPMGVNLTWSYSGSTPYEVEIQKNSGSGYVTIGYVEGIERDFFDAKNLSNGNSYYYRVRAFDESGNSSIWSNGVLIVFNAIPSAPSNFSVLNTCANQMLLTWTNTISYSFNTSIIVKRKSSIAYEWQTIATLPSNVNYFVDTSVMTNYPNNLYHYQISYLNGNGSSDAVFDVDYCTSRINGQPIYMGGIAVKNLGEIESYVFGAPEFDISIATMKSDGTVPEHPLKSKFRYEPEYRWGGLKDVDGFEIIYFPIDEDKEIILDNWDKQFAQSVMSILIVEYDGEWFSGNIDISMGLKKPEKNKDAGIIDASASGSLKLDYKSSDKTLSTEFIYFWENPIIVRHYGYGVKVIYSNEPNLGLEYLPRYGVKWWTL